MSCTRVLRSLHSYTSAVHKFFPKSTSHLKILCVMKKIPQIKTHKYQNLIARAT